MNHGVVANTLPKALRDLLIEHIDGRAFIEGHAALRGKSTKLIAMGLVELSTGQAAQSTKITDAGRQVLVCILARYAEVLTRAGYTGFESPNTRRGGQAAAEVDAIGWKPHEWRVETRHGAAVLRGKRQAAIFELLWKSSGVQGMTRERIVDIVYADDPDGGPLADSIHETIRRMRRNLLPAGVEIRRGTTGGNGYSLAVASELVAF